MYRRYLAALLAWLAAFGAGMAALGLLFDPVRGDLTRVGYYSENAHGGHAEAYAFVPPLAVPGRRGVHYDIIVVGDSFSQPTTPDRQTPWGGFWTDHVAAATGLSIGVFNNQAITVETLLADDALRRDPPRLVVVESVERMLRSQFNLAGPCPVGPPAAVPLLPRVSAPPQPVKLPPTTGKILDPARGEYLLAFAATNAVRFAMGWDGTDVLRLRLAHADLFTSRNASDLLVYAEDYERSAWPDAAWQRITCRIRAIQAAVTADRRTGFLLFIAPDKSSAYRDFLAPHFRPVDAASRLSALSDIPQVRADLALRAAIAEGVADVYLPDDTHWGDPGTRIAATAVMRALAPTLASRVP